MNMLITEWKMEDALAVRYEEGREEGREDKQEEIARNALAMDLSIDKIQKLTGLGIETINRLRAD